jgi:hypothetical protein
MATRYRKTGKKNKRKTNKRRFRGGGCTPGMYYNRSGFGTYNPDSAPGQGPWRQCQGRSIYTGQNEYGPETY